MRTLPISRWLLSLLLIWQLGANAYAQAYTDMPTHTQQAAVHEPCPEHEQAVHDEQMTDMVMAQDVTDMDGANTHSTSTDHCKSSVCKSACAGALLTLPPLSSIGTVTMDDSANTPGFTTVFVSAPPSKLLRPPI